MLTSTEKQTYIGAMVQKIVDNLQIEIKGIHIRYEDDTNTPEVRTINPHQHRYPDTADMDFEVNGLCSPSACEKESMGA